MLNVVLQIFMTLIPVVAYFNYKKLSTNKHLITMVVLSILATLLAVGTQIEIWFRTLVPIGTTPVLPELVYSFLIPIGMESILYWLVALFSGLTVYFVGWLVAVLVDGISGVLR